MIEINVIPIQSNMIPMRDISTISKGDRLFYELGYKKNVKLAFGDNWIGEGKFKEILDIDKYVKSDTHLTDLEYLEHHNFMLIKNTNN